MKYIIIGNGAAGMDAAQAIRKNDPHGEITLISKSRNLHYYRPRLIEFLAGEVPLEKLVTFKPEFYEKKGISNLLNTRIVSINAEEKTVTDSEGKSYTYDKLLIASGGFPFVPPIEGVDKSGVFTLRGASDAGNILNAGKEAKNIVVIGGGLLGLETAKSLAQAGKKITVIEFASWLLPRQLDETGGKLLQELLEENGMSFLTNDSVTEIAGNDRVETVVLKSGSVITADMVIISAGVRPNLALGQSAQLEVDKGIVVNNHMETSKPGIYAAGDVVEHKQRVYGLWPAAKEQGKVAGENMAGKESEYPGTVLSSNLKVTGIDLYSAGEIHDDDLKVHVAKNNGSYKKFLLKENKPCGAIVLGDSDAVKIAQKVMNGRAEPEEFIKLF
ncbi:MAG: NAD(P)/FAD-dependent oxidoreductase [bacterium]|nr:NAD(P)/FAD-dependent oxidoreductase [bacterium]